MLGVTVTGCSDDAATEERSAEQSLEDAYETMKSLTSVAIEAETTRTDGERFTSVLATDLKSTCTFRSSSESGAALEQIRIKETDYIRPNRAYLDQWAGRRRVRRSRTAGSRNRPVSRCLATGFPTALGRSPRSAR
ncbi:hypothetical protein ACR6C2_16090 [Streptomyces sp. INA 01156]